MGLQSVVESPAVALKGVISSVPAVGDIPVFTRGLKRARSAQGGLQCSHADRKGLYQETGGPELVTTCLYRQPGHRWSLGCGLAR